METVDKVVLVMIVTFVTSMLIIGGYLVGKEGKEKSYCELRDGHYYKGLCFKNEYMIKVD